MQKIFSLAVMMVLIAAHASAEDDQSPWYEPYEEITYTELRTLIDSDKVEAARVLNDGWWVTVKTKEGKYFDARVTPQTPIADRLYEAGVRVSIEHGSQSEEEDPLWLSLILNILPLVIFIVFIAFIMLFMGRVNKKQADKYDDYLAKSDEHNQRHLERIEKLQTEFFDRLHSILARQKDSNG